MYIFSLHVIGIVISYPARDTNKNFLPIAIIKCYAGLLNSFIDISLRSNVWMAVLRWNNRIAHFCLTRTYDCVLTSLYWHKVIDILHKCLEGEKRKTCRRNGQVRELRFSGAGLGGRGPHWQLNVSIFLHSTRQEKRSTRME